MEHIIIDTTKPITYRADDIVFVIGRFQALHIGHQHLFVQAKAKFPHRKLGILTFFPDPRDFFSERVHPKILTHAERLAKFEQLGVDVVIEFVFHQAFASMTRQAFITLLESLEIQHIVHGEDFRFGRADDTTHVENTMMQSVGDLYVNHAKVSSSQLNQYVQEGRIDLLNAALNYPYFLSGEVIAGDRRARKLGFPTANVMVDLEKMLPYDGVYATKTVIAGEMFDSVTHIGSSPTFQREKKTIETHIFGMDNDLYGQTLDILFFERIRGVQTFSGVDAVKAQLQRDVEQVKQYFQLKNS